MRRTGHVAYIRTMRKAQKVLARKPEGKRLLLRLSYRWEDNIKMDLE
jgi:hypothetical protein